MTTTRARPAELNDQAERAGRVALATQGALYVIVGLLALGVARGDDGDRPSQAGALESLARQPFGGVLLVAAAVGLATHIGWRLWLAVVGEPGPDDDAGSVAKRAANVGRAAIYGSFLLAALRLLTEDEGSGGGEEQERTSTVLTWPGGVWIVAAAGLIGLGVAGWNLRKAVTGSFLDDLDTSRRPRLSRRALRRLGAAGYAARAAAFALLGWFLLDAARQHDPSESRGLDDALRELTTAAFGPVLLAVLAAGLVAFGGFRILDGLLRRRDALTRA